MTTPSDVATFMQRAGPQLLQGNRQLVQAIELKLSDTDFRGLAVIAPAQVGADVEKTLPLVIAVQKTVMRGWEVTEQENLAIALMDLDTGELQIARLLVDPKADERAPESLERPPRPSVDAGKAVVTKVYQLNARDRLDVPWRQASIAVSALAFDWISNVARVELAGGMARPRPGPRTIAPLPAAGAALPSFDATPHHPPLPPRGVAFRIQQTQSGSFVMRLAYARTLAAADILPTPQTLRTASGARTAVAAIPMTLAVVGLDQRIPGIVSWSLPVLGTAPPSPGQPANGHMAIDLRSAGVISGAGQYAAYVFMDAEVYGPHRFDVQ